MKRQWLVLLLIAALLIGSCFVYADEAAGSGITIEIEGQAEGVLPEGSFTAKVSVDPSLDLESLALLAAFYEENGRFLGCKSIPVDPETAEGSVSVDNSSGLSSMKVFAIGKESAVPVTEAAEAARPEPEAERTAVVVVFSATGNTRGVAGKIAALTGADLREIVPAQPYTDADLNYSDGGSRTSKEQNDPDARPEIAEEISLEGYDTVYLGYPIWWGKAPRILCSFVEGHDFDGKTVIPFCTSGSSDIGQSDDALAELAGSGNWLQGKRFPGSVTEETLKAWIDGLEEEIEQKPAVKAGFFRAAITGSGAERKQCPGEIV